MDASFQTGQPKKQKLSGEKEEGGSMSLSKLPDVLIEQIISFLPTKDAIRTSILSKRWEYLWTSLPELKFIQGRNETRCSFVTAVDRALILRGPADLKQFLLLFRGLEQLDDASRVNRWITAMLRRNVEELILRLSNSKELSLPRSLFTSATLTYLDIIVPCIFKVPSTVCLSSLRMLRLQCVVFSDDCSTQQLFSGCPVLEDLILGECSWGNCKFVSICAPKLLRLEIDEDIDFYPKGSDGCQIMIFGVSLTNFYYSGEFRNHYCFNNSSVDKARIFHFSDEKSRHMSYGFNKLLGGLSSVKKLAINSDSLEVIQIHATELLTQMPLLNHLTTLKLEAEEVVPCSKALLRMLGICPYLQTLIFFQEINLSSDDANNDGVLEPLPPCFLTSLKQIEVREFYGDENNLCAIKILLKNAMVLETMILTCMHNFVGGSEKKKDVNKQLSDLPKGSESCEVVLV
ncbi:putative F-box domain, FBD domain, leucine-rich repeat domain, L domain-containing protein [Rosa chinensis]|uniref:Putative F-box domain, FBD domain, leucine-rich repeat domain, L domain-containing protein n=1 Tax=Rosa chinensis TaxID=74649 RepID=A0A2P6QK10_ROSCH|nr:F-box/LRR-repeat protein At3g26922 [Rosa chinensis]XP_024160490.1 F-box/LRR-repeat protein At3g26922 [Rosa chinensis]XP_040363063.1 F-box/LRR-repeat protein At3g26922 [Rosa chinensis]XP_040363064.1 F-box/LRR-repeat protein At3g26922 [Rosa chinensis]PRQ34515.1 putative F-box domain, FBD domain, leucine-rich repeat domain, L domain-containing protein [Rosa chinensis]